MASVSGSSLARVQAEFVPTAAHAFRQRGEGGMQAVAADERIRGLMGLHHDQALPQEDGSAITLSA